jgi:hypothetical protein
MDGHWRVARNEGGSVDVGTRDQRHSAAVEALRAADAYVLVLPALGPNGEPAVQIHVSAPYDIHDPSEVLLFYAGAAEATAAMLDKARERLTGEPS